MGMCCYILRKTQHWMIMVVSLIIIAIILPSQMLFPSIRNSTASVMFVSRQALQIDAWGLRLPFLFLEWIEMNTVPVFVMAAEGIFAAFVNGWFYENPDKSLVCKAIN